MESTERERKAIERLLADPEDRGQVPACLGFLLAALLLTGFAPGRAVDATTPETARAQRARFADYLSEVRRKVKSQWKPEELDRAAVIDQVQQMDRLTVVQFQVSPTGALLLAGVEQSSGVALLDEEALK